MTNDEMFAMALNQALTDEIAECEKLPDHKFSREFDRMMKKLLQNSISDEHHTSGLRVGRRFRIAVIIVISVFLLAGAAATSYYLWKNFRLQDRGLYTLLRYERKRQGRNHTVVQHNGKGWLKVPKIPIVFCAFVQNLRIGVRNVQKICL